MNLKKMFCAPAILSFVFAGAVLSAARAFGADSRASAVYVAPMTGIVGVPMEEYVESVFEDIGNDENAVLIFKMDTPGGLVDSMSQIMTYIAESDFPVAVWVGPSGARAASAGAFIIQSAHIAAMAPETNIGAAHPVTGGGKDIDSEEMSRKILNDLTAKMRAFAQERGRNAEIAESMIRDSVSLTAREAFEQYVVDFIADDERDLIEQMNGREVKVKGRSVVLDLDNYEIKRLDMSVRQKALGVFSRPDIAYLALIAGIFLIILEVKSPGGFAMGVTGGILLLTAAYGLRVLPVNIAGVALLVGGIIIIIADLMIGGVGILALAGLGAMLAGGLMMYRAPGAELLNISTGFIFGVTLVTGAVFFLIMRLIVKALRRKPASGVSGMIGERAEILKASGEGAVPMVLIHGEYWKVAPGGEFDDIFPGDEVEVTGIESMTLLVKPVRTDHPRE